jgi:hypothetical protein
VLGLIKMGVMLESSRYTDYLLDSSGNPNTRHGKRGCTSFGCAQSTVVLLQLHQLGRQVGLVKLGVADRRALPRQ